MPADAVSDTEGTVRVDGVAARILSWDELDRLYPGCSAEWDVATSGRPDHGPYLLRERVGHSDRRVLPLMWCRQCRELRSHRTRRTSEMCGCWVYRPPAGPWEEF